MTFQEYKNQTEPRRLSIGAVQVTKNDCIQVIEHNNRTYVVLDFSYLNKPNDNGSLQLSGITYQVIDGLCWSLDKDGNPKARSVFSYQS